MAKFKSGEIVVLKSGGPKMTVIGYRKSNPKTLICTWFDSKNERQTEAFNENTLDLQE